VSTACSACVHEWSMSRRDLDASLSTTRLESMQRATKRDALPQMKEVIATFWGYPGIEPGTSRKPKPHESGFTLSENHTARPTAR
jgi:hypothetical protein